MREVNNKLILSGEFQTPSRPSLGVTHLEFVTHPEVAGLEIRQINPFTQAVDVRPLLMRSHPNWQGELEEVARQAPDKVIRGGSILTSLAPSDFNTYYQPTNGTTIAQYLPWLHNLFTKDFRYLVEKATGDTTLHLGNDLQHSLNMNYLQEGGYEMHTDRNRITALLGVTTIESGEGGELVLYERLNQISNQPEGERYKISPISGVLYIFDGKNHPHKVTPLKRKKPRLVVPGDYYSDAVTEVIDQRFNALIGVADAA